MKKKLRKTVKDYKNIRLYATSESVVNSYCTDTSGSTTRIHDSGTVRCN